MEAIQHKKCRDVEGLLYLESRLYDVNNRTAFRGIEECFPVRYIAIPRGPQKIIFAVFILFTQHAYIKAIVPHGPDQL